MGNKQIMNKLDKYFTKWKPETDVVVVGCSPSLRWYDFGKYIDQFKTVIRINICLKEGMFNHTGKKLDIWATTGNNRWDGYSPLDISNPSEVWPRVSGYADELKANGTLDNFKGPVTAMDRSGVSGFGVGLGTGLIAINHAIERYGKVTLIGHTFYLESEDAKCYDFHSELEDAEHKKNRLEHHNKNSYGLRALKYVQDWRAEDKAVLLNPWEYDNLRGVHDGK